MWVVRGGGGFGALLFSRRGFISQDVLLQSSFEKQKIVAFTAVSANSKTSEHWKGNWLIVLISIHTHHFSIVKATSRKFFHVLLWSLPALQNPSLNSRPSFQYSIAPTTPGSENWHLAPFQGLFKATSSEAVFFTSFLWEILTHIDFEEAAGRRVITMNLEYLLSRSFINILSYS